MKKPLLLLLAVLYLPFALGCSTTTVATEFNGVKDLDGRTVKHVSTTNYAIHLLFTKPLVGDATLPTAVSEFTNSTKGEGCSKASICQSSTSYYWYVLGPITIILTPTITNVAGDAVP